MHDCIFFLLDSRVGDSPIPGAAAYVDKNVGGAAGTGDGDVMLKFLPRYAISELILLPGFCGGKLGEVKEHVNLPHHGFRYFP